MRYGRRSSPITTSRASSTRHLPESTSCTRGTVTSANNTPSSSGGFPHFCPLPSHKGRSSVTQIRKAARRYVHASLAGMSKDEGGEPNIKSGGELSGELQGEAAVRTAASNSGNVAKLPGPSEISTNLSH